MSHENMHKAIVIGMAAGLIEQLVEAMDDEGIEIARLEIKMHGKKTGEISTAALVSMLRVIADEFRPLSIVTHRTETADDGG